MPWALAEVIKYGHVLADQLWFFLSLAYAWFTAQRMHISTPLSNMGYFYSPQDNLLKKEQKNWLMYVTANSRSQPKRECARHNFRLKMELSFDIQDTKQAFAARIERTERSLASSAVAH